MYIISCIYTPIIERMCYITRNYIIHNIIYASTDTRTTAILFTTRALLSPPFDITRGRPLLYNSTILHYAHTSFAHTYFSPARGLIRVFRGFRVHHRVSVCSPRLSRRAPAAVVSLHRRS